MAECNVETKKEGISSLTAVILTIVVAMSIIAAVLTPMSEEFMPGIEAIVDTLLNITTNMIYLIGGGVIIFGAVLVTIRFVQCKLKDPYKPTCVTRFLSGYLTLSLEFFIGAEIIRTVVTRTYEEFSLLILVIFSRGLFSLILYLERRWHGSVETE
ncbi:MAG: DUF1622 domain-containing protein [Candidatus Bathyarchaeota archaeon]|nr:DUF1622 domain-containing protein [Candidatus Bathyarchaeota archaeon]